MATMTQFGHETLELSGRQVHGVSGYRGQGGTARRTVS
jgi:hypothetical protein